MNSLGVALLIPLVACAQSIRGKIVDQIPLSLRNVPVRLLPIGADGVTKSTHTDSNGTFRFSPVEPGEYMVIAGGDGSIRQVLVARALSKNEVDLGTLKLKDSSCDSPGIYCDYFSAPRPTRPPAPVIDLCEALKSHDRYGNTVVVVVGTLTTLNGLPALTATCGSALASGGLTWTNAVLLPWQAAPQLSPTLPIPDLRRKLAELAAAVRKTSGSATAKAVAFMDSSTYLMASQSCHALAILVRGPISGCPLRVF